MAVLVGVVFYEQFREMQKLVGNVTDFRMFYEAAGALGAGEDPYAATDGGYFYPPTFAFYFRLLHWQPIAGASLLWFTLKLTLVAWTIKTVFRLVGGDALSGAKRRWLIFGAIVVVVRFLIGDLGYGNSNTFILWLTVAAVALDMDDRPVLAGLALAGAVSIKVVPLVFAVYFLASGRWRVLLWLAVWVVVINGLPFVAGYADAQSAWRSYFDAGVATKLNDPLAQPDNQSLWGLLNRLVDWPLSVTRIIWLVLSMTLVGIAGWITFRLRSVRTTEPTKQAGAASLFFLLGLLVSPGSWVVHYSAALLPMTYLLIEAQKGTAPTRLLWAAFIAANVAFSISGWSRATVRWSIEHSWYVIAIFFMFVVLSVVTFRTTTRVER